KKVDFQERRRTDETVDSFQAFEDVHKIPEFLSKLPKAPFGGGRESENRERARSSGRAVKHFAVNFNRFFAKEKGGVLCRERRSVDGGASNEISVEARRNFIFFGV
ncbi:MAG: hypothetical protein IJ991_00590, partial [Thermoguttaceae bacterium]|nr:hypothetical protein [Thermoguttaceae bacterium]